MKRFLVDAFFILLLVSIGSYMSEPQTKEDVNVKIEDFEDQIAKHQPIQQMVEDTSLNKIEDNAVARFAKSSSEIVVDVMDTSVSIVSELFQGLMK